MSHFWTNVLSVVFAILSVFLIFVVLLQRGRGGGLAGAFGASGGQSAFGTKAGDVFTKITVGMAIVWVALAAVTGVAMQHSRSAYNPGESEMQAPPSVDAAAPAKSGGAQTSPFEAGDQKSTAGPGAKGPAKQAAPPAGGKSSAAGKSGAAENAPAKAPAKGPAPMNAPQSK